MQAWQIKALELEATALKSVDGFVHEHALYFLIGIIYLLLALLAWVLSGALRRRDGKSMSHVRPAIVIHLPGPAATAAGYVRPVPAAPRAAGLQRLLPGLNPSTPIQDY